MLLTQLLMLHQNIIKLSLKIKNWVSGNKFINLQQFWCVYSSCGNWTKPYGSNLLKNANELTAMTNTVEALVVFAENVDGVKVALEKLETGIDEQARILKQIML